MDVTGLRRLHKTIRSIVLLTAAGLAAGSAWAAGPVVRVNIPAGDAEQMLMEFARQAKIQPFFPSRVVRGFRTNAVEGEFEASDALARMLEGTPITFQFSAKNPRHVYLEAPGTADPLAPKPSSPDPASDRTRQLAALMDHFRGSDDRLLEEVTVTGTRIRGLDAITAPLIFLKKPQVKRTGYAAVQDLLYQLPLTSLAGPREDVAGESNFNRGTSVNLRGLGAGATLVLVNGRRQPASGLDGDFIDVSTIPWSVVDTIEVMPDGASAIYGSDAIGGVVNIILRKDLDGAETRTRVATVKGGGDETLFAQLFAKELGDGHFLFAYQFSDRSALPFSARAYAADTDKTPFGGSNFSSILSNPGNILDPMTLLPMFAIPGGQDGMSLDPDDLLPGVNFQNTHEGADLLPRRQAHSVYLTAANGIGDRLEWFAEARFNQRDLEQSGPAAAQILTVPSTNAFYPFSDTPFALVGYSFLEDLGTIEIAGRTRTWNGTLGLNATLSDTWKASLTGWFGEERLDTVAHNLVDAVALSNALADDNPATAFNPFGSGSSTNPATLETLRTTQRSHATSTISGATLVVDGPIFSSSAGDAKAAFGIDVREERFRRGVGLGTSPITLNDYRRTISAAFVEFAIPLGRELDLSLAGRHESYNDFGSTFNPKIGLRWSPVEQLRLRSSWGTSFRAPVLIDLDEVNLSASGLLPVPDPQAADGRSWVLLRVGRNADLKEESASTWTAGFDFVPKSLPDFALSLTYFVVDYDDRIARPGPASPADALLMESDWPAIITRNPSQATVAAICAASNFVGTPGSCSETPPSAIVDMRLRNLASTNVNGVDASLKQRLDSPFGEFRFDVTGTYLFGFKQQLTATLPSVDVRDTVGNPASLRVRGAIDWYQFGEEEAGFAAGAVINFVGDYVDKVSEPDRSVSSSTTLDLELSYRTPRGAGLFDDVEVALSAVNVFDEDPPFLNDPLGYDTTNFRPVGRIVGLHIQKNW